jgi:hypothetical protein
VSTRFFFVVCVIHKLLYIASSFNQSFWPRFDNKTVANTMKKNNGLFSLDALAGKIQLDKMEMRAIKGGDILCYCNGVSCWSTKTVEGCILACQGFCA